jgi:hypothetical protein
VAEGSWSAEEEASRRDGERSVDLGLSIEAARVSSYRGEPEGVQKVLDVLPSWEETTPSRRACLSSQTREVSAVSSVVEGDVCLGSLEEIQRRSMVTRLS